MFRHYDSEDQEIVARVYFKRFLRDSWLLFIFIFLLAVWLILLFIDPIPRQTEVNTFNWNTYNNMIESENKAEFIDKFNNKKMFITGIVSGFDSNGVCKIKLTNEVDSIYIEIDYDYIKMEYDDSINEIKVGDNITVYAWMIVNENGTIVGTRGRVIN